MPYVADYSWARPPVAQLAAHYIGVIRYVSGDRSKDLSLGELEALHAAGLGVGLVWETTDKAALGGRAKGAEHVVRRDALADALGWPLHKVIPMAVDFDVMENQLSTVAAYFAGAKENARRPVGVYGSFGVLEHLATHEPVACYWQCAGWSGRASASDHPEDRIWVPADGGYRRLSRRACLFQQVGEGPVAGTDLNEVLTTPGSADILWHPAEAFPGPTKEEDLVKAVTCPPNKTAWRPVIINGRRYREAYSEREDLDLDLSLGAVGGEVELTGPAVGRFLYRYAEGIPYEGPRLVNVAAGSAWADAAGVTSGSALFYLVPNRYIVRVHDDAQRDSDAWLGVPTQDVSEALLWNQPLLPWVSRDPGDVEALAALIAGALVGHGSEVTPGTVKAIAKQVVAEFAEQLKPR